MNEFENLQLTNGLLGITEWWSATQKFELRNCPRSSVRRPARRLRSRIRNAMKTPNFLIDRLAEMESPGEFAMEWFDATVGLFVNRDE